MDGFRFGPPFSCGRKCLEGLLSKGDATIALASIALGPALPRKDPIYAAVVSTTNQGL